MTGQVTPEVTGACHWDCSSLNEAARFTGKDVVLLARACNAVFEIVANENIEAPDCGLTYAEENGGRRFTHA